MESALAFLEEEDPKAARLLASRVSEAIKRLRRYPLIGRPGLEIGTREWVVDRTPYVLVYRIEDGWLTLLRVWHSARQRGESGEPGAA